MTKPQSKRKPQLPEADLKRAAESLARMGAAARQPHFRHCADCGCFKVKHHESGVCRRYPQPLTKEVGEGCWDSIPRPAVGDEQITEVASTGETQGHLQERLRQSPA